MTKEQWKNKLSRKSKGYQTNGNIWPWDKVTLINAPIISVEGTPVMILTINFISGKKYNIVRKLPKLTKTVKGIFYGEKIVILTADEYWESNNPEVIKQEKILNDIVLAFKEYIISKG